jgi:serine/threonine protein kinase
MADRYQIKGRIGRGGIGAIYRAYDSILKRDVAIKRLLPLEETNLNESAENTLNREAEALSRLQHPNVITLFAFEEDEEGPFVVMEYIEGDTLKDTIDNGALSYEDFQIVANQCLDPLITAQELGLLHRDIKPANIMLQWLSSGSFQVKILDFGLAKFSQTPSLQTLDQTGSFLGSIEYLAPEQLELKPLDPRTDIYSLGCVLYYCLAQRSPFDGNNPATTTTNHLAHVVTHISEIREDIPSPIAEWLMLLISRQPADRPKDAREALKMFKAAQAGQTPRVESASPAVAIPVSGPVATAPPAMARPVVTAPPAVSGPVSTLPEPSGPVAPPPSVSGPIPVAQAIPVNAPPPPTAAPTKKLITGPQQTAPGSATKKLLTSPAANPGTGTNKLITGTGPQRTVTGSQPVSVPPTTQTGRIARIPISKVDGKESSARPGPAQGARNIPPTVWAIVGLVIIILALLGYLFVSRSGGNRQSNASPVEPGQEKTAPAISKPPVNKGLVLQACGARSVLSTHSDTPVEDQEQLLVSSPNNDLLNFKILREKDDSEVFLTEAITAKNSELNYSQPAIRFEAGAAVDFRSKESNSFFLALAA